MDETASIEAFVAYGSHRLHGPARVTFSPDRVEILGSRVTASALRRAFVLRAWSAGLGGVFLFAATLVPDVWKVPALALMLLAAVVFFAEGRPDLLGSEESRVCIPREDVISGSLVDEDTRFLFTLVFGFSGLWLGRRRRGVVLSVADGERGEIDYEFRVDSPEEFVELVNAARASGVAHVGS